MKKYRRLVVILILSVLTVLGLLRLGDIDVNRQTLAQVDWPWLLLAFLTFQSSLVARGLRWRRILKTMGWPLRYGYAQTLLVAGMFISTVLPARAGDLGRVGMLKHDHKIPIAHGLASIATERALDIFAILILAALGATWALHGRVPPEISRLMIVVSLMFLAGLVGLLVFPGIENWLRKKARASRFISPQLRSRYERWRLARVVNFGFTLVHGVRALGQSPLNLALAVTESFYIWLCDALVIHFVLIGVGAALPLSASLVSGMVSGLAAGVPLTPGALGQFDAVLLSMLALFAVGRTQISLTLLLVRLVNLWTFIPISGLVTYAFGFARAFNLNSQSFVPDEGPGSNSVPTLIES